jgi:hypothetical protein
VDEAAAAGRPVADGHRHFHRQQHTCTGAGSSNHVAVQNHAYKDSGEKYAQMHAQARRMHTDTCKCILILECADTHQSRQSERTVLFTKGKSRGEALRKNVQKMACQPQQGGGCRRASTPDNRNKGASSDERARQTTETRGRVQTSEHARQSNHNRICGCEKPADVGSGD